MEIFTAGILGLHLLGVLAIVWGLASQLGSKQRVVSGVAVVGARAQILTGILLVILDFHELYFWRTVLKVILAIVILGALEAFRKKMLSQWVYWGVWGVLIIQIGLASMISSK